MKTFLEFYNSKNENDTGLATAVDQVVNAASRAISQAVQAFEANPQQTHQFLTAVRNRLNALVVSELGAVQQNRQQAPVAPAPVNRPVAQQPAFQSPVR